VVSKEVPADKSRASEGLHLRGGIAKRSAANKKGQGGGKNAARRAGGVPGGGCLKKSQASRCKFMRKHTCGMLMHKNAYQYLVFRKGGSEQRVDRYMQRERVRQRARARALASLG
jgi:hypothetical protein